MANAAEVLAGRLYAAGCRHAFGIPGGEVLTVVRALAEAGIEFHLVKHENCAGFMGEGVYHADGAPAILVATLGPGAANAVNVVANALQDRVPMIFVTGCVDPDEAATYTHQILDHNALLSPVTKASLTLVDGAAHAIADKALAICRDGQPGPVHVDVPIGVAAREQAASTVPMRATPARLAPAQSAALAEARARFSAAERPLMVAGVDVLDQGAHGAVADLAIAYGIPLITTYKAKGVLSENHPLALGGAGLSPKADKILMPLVAHSDCIILAGYDPIEMRTGWRNPWPEHAAVIEFSAVPNTHYMHQATHSFVCDTCEGLRALSAGVEPRVTWPGGEPAHTRAALAERFGVDSDWGATQVIALAREVLPANTVASVDSGAHRILLSQMWRCYEPRGLLQSSALCTMGSAVPLAIGRKLAEPDRPVVAFVGDAGMEMFLGELATARDLGLPVIVVVFVDASLALIELKQRGMGHANVGVDFGPTDFARVAEAMGGNGVTVASAAEYRAALEQALGANGFTVIACQLPRKSYDGRF